MVAKGYWHSVLDELKFVLYWDGATIDNMDDELASKDGNGASLD
jgi:hypothetical protein